MLKAETNPDDDMALALSALTWILSDGGRAERLLALTGLDVAGLRSRIHDPMLHQAIFSFLDAHEPDLVACADALAVRPERLVRAERFR